MAAKRIRLIDIGVNLTDPVFRGIYRGKNVHADDLVQVLERARNAGVERMMITGGNLVESEEALELAKQHEGLYSTAGVHPTRCSEFDAHPSGPADYFAKLLDLAAKGKESGQVVAIGELGLDFDPDRLKFCPRETQEKYFESQLGLSETLKLPLFLHNRDSTEAFVEILKRNRSKWTKGVAHSFTGTKEELRTLLDVEGLYIGLNGCSLKTAENLEVAKEVPLDRLMLESDAPYCDIRRTHAGYIHVAKDMEGTQGTKKEKFEPGKPVRERNEPSATRWVAAVVAAVKGLPIEDVCEAAWKNTCDVFFGGK